MSDAHARLREVAEVFLRLGVTGFGGPAAHVAVMQSELVERRGWLTRERFLDLLAITNLLPGPNSTEMALHLGRERAGLRGLFVAGACFITPAAVLSGLLGWAYTRFGALPDARAVLTGLRPVVIAVIAKALWDLGRTTLRGSFAWATALIVTALSLAGAHELALLAGAGAAWTLARGGTVRLGVFAPWGISLGAWALPMGPSGLFAVFLKIGAVTYGSGYVLVAFVRSELVEQRHWITAGQLLDAVSAGQVTPGPLFSTATFVGQVVAGPWGALAATAGIFAPAFAFVIALAPTLERLRDRPRTAALLDGVRVASLGLMAAVWVSLARESLLDAMSWTLTALAAVVLLRTRVNPTWLLAAGALAGVARARAGV